MKTKVSLEYFVNDCKLFPSQSKIYTILYYTLYYTILYYTILYYIILYYTIIVYNYNINFLSKFQTSLEAYIKEYLTRFYK